MLERLATLLKGIFGIGSNEKKPKQGNIEEPAAKAENELKKYKSDLAEGLRQLAEVKAIYIRMRKETESRQRLSLGYENKARLLLQKAAQGEISEQQADLLAAQALKKRNEIDQEIQASSQAVGVQTEAVKRMEEYTRQLKKKIIEWESELKTLRARSKISETQLRMQQSMSGLDKADTNELFRDMRDKVTEQEVLADTYRTHGGKNNETELDREINRILGGEDEVQKSLAALKGEVQHKLEENQGPESDFGSVSSTSSVDPAVSEELERLKRKLKE